MTHADDAPRAGDSALGWTRETISPSGTCVFVDRDGVINERADGGFVLAWDAFRFRPDALEALRILRAADLPVVVVSNQSCVGRGMLTIEALQGIMARMVDELERNGAPLSAWYCCPHAPDAGCDCRKPKPGMLLRGAREGGFDLSRSHMIGDAASDEAAARAAGTAFTHVDPRDPGAFSRAARAIATIGRSR